VSISEQSFRVNETLKDVSLDLQNNVAYLYTSSLTHLVVNYPQTDFKSSLYFTSDIGMTHYLPINTMYAINTAYPDPVNAFTFTDQTNYKIDFVGVAGRTYATATKYSADSGIYRFVYTGAVQTMVVPVDAVSLDIECVGAAGGSINASLGGNGGRVQVSLDANVGGYSLQGQTIYIFVGGMGTYGLATTDGGGSITGSTQGGYNGGGVVVAGSLTTTAGIGGGGASDIRLVSAALSSRIVVAGGGGAGSSWYGTGSTYVNGGNGGGLVGANGQDYRHAFTHIVQATGGTQSAGGTNTSSSSFNGALGLGGNCTIQNSSGGGGGYYGGAAGGGQTNFGSSGAGGSSYTDPTYIISSPLHTQGYAGAVGNGYIIIKVNR